MDNVIKRLPFNEIQDSVRASKSNSDLANLARALENIALARQELDALEIEINSTIVSVEHGDIVPVETIKRLYNASHQFPKNSL